ncbi:MAG: GvpL/GvpF family gas vesicle protein [Chloroflexi bacterium]|nr:GvpL/GvpF family gas vesicle protein [Chloroflexota bacterium]
MTEASRPGAGLYLYGLTLRQGAGERLRSAGVERDAPVETVVQGGLAALVSRVPLGMYEPERIAAMLHAGDAQWVEERALAHATVLQEAMQRGPVIPARFGILYRDPDRLLATLAAQERELEALLRWLTGKVEWGLKVLCYKEPAAAALRAHDSEVQALQERLKGLPQGMAYLQQKRLDLLLETKLQTGLIALAREIDEALAGVSEATQALEVREEETTAPEGAVALQGAYLVCEEKGHCFRAELERLGNEWGRWGVRLDLSGPWPPYHFAQALARTDAP